MTDVLNSERLQQVGSVLERYAKYIAPGHIIRLGMEGDPVSAFRSAEEAPSGRVLDVTRHEGGEISFRASVGDKVITLNNRDVDPARIWEIHPDHLSSFREDIFRGEELDNEAEALAPADEDFAQKEEIQEDTPTQEAFEEKTQELREEHQKYRSAVDEHMQRIEAKLEEQIEKERHFRAAMAAAVRGLSDDMLRAQRGDVVQFAEDYASSFDRHVKDRDDKVDKVDEVDRVDEEFRGDDTTDSRFPEDFSDVDDKVEEPSRFAGIEGNEGEKEEKEENVKRTSTISDLEKGSNFTTSSTLTD